MDWSSYYAASGASHWQSVRLVRGPGDGGKERFTLSFRPHFRQADVWLKRGDTYMSDMCNRCREHPLAVGSVPIYLTGKVNAPDNQLKSAAQLVQERSAFLALPRHDWMISLGKKTRKVTCVHKTVYEQLLRRRCVQKMPPREQFIMEVGPLFGKELCSTVSLHDFTTAVGVVAYSM